MKELLLLVAVALAVGLMALALMPRDNPADCAARGERYFKEIGSYPYLSDGRRAVDVARERCQRSPSAF